MKKLSYLFTLTLIMAFGFTNAQNCGADFYYSVNGLTVDFNDSSWTNSSTGITSWSWNFDDQTTNSSLTNPTHTYASGGTYVVCLTINDSSRCSSTYCDTIVLTAPPIGCTASFTYTTYTLNNAYFTSTVTPTSAINPVYSWDFGDGNSDTAANPVHNYATAGTYVVTLTAISSTGDTCTAVDSVVFSSITPAACNASYTIALDSSLAFSVVLYNTSTNASSHVYSWDFGDGTTGSGRTPVHSYVSFGSYVVCLTITDTVLGCSPSVFCDTVGMDTAGNLKAGFGIKVLEPIAVGIDEKQDDFANLNVYPNPANNIINLDLTAIDSPLNIRIMDLSGRTLLEKRNNQSGNIESFDVSQFNKGIYFILLDNGSSQRVEKFIVAD